MKITCYYCVFILQWYHLIMKTYTVIPDFLPWMILSVKWKMEKRDTYANTRIIVKQLGAIYYLYCYMANSGFGEGSDTTYFCQHDSEPLWNLHLIPMTKFGSASRD